MDGTGLDFYDVTPELCPLDNRRSSKEVWMKLFAVHLTTVAAFCHVLSLRRERIISWRLLAYLLEPVSIFVFHAAGIAIILFSTMGWILFDRTSKFGRNIGRAICLFLASRPRDPDDVSEDEIEPVLKRLGRVLLACAYLAQCCGTLTLFIRRANHDAVTWADIRIVEVASTGILIAVYWILLAAQVPIFVRPLPAEIADLSDFGYTEIDILKLRGVVLIIRRGENWAWHQKAFVIYGNYYLCVIPLIIKASYLWHEKVPREALLFKSSLLMQWIQYFAPNFIHAFYHFIVGSWIFYCGRASPSDGTVPRRRPPAKWIVAKGIWIFFMVMVLQVPIFGWFVYAQWLQIAEQLRELELSPIDQKCPLLWSDPAANWIWALG